VRAAGLAVEGDAAGAHVLVPLPDGGTERAVVAEAAARGVGLDGVARHHSGPPSRYGIVLGYAGPSREELEWALPVVREALAAR
jgi:GntR family transcriptional regulator/MocR family aminotransferase